MPNTRLEGHMVECEQAIEQAYGEKGDADYSNVDFDSLKNLLDRNTQLIHALKQYDEQLQPVFNKLNNRFSKLKY